MIQCAETTESGSYYKALVNIVDYKSNGREEILRKRKFKRLEYKVETRVVYIKKKKSLTKQRQWSVLLKMEKVHRKRIYEKLQQKKAVELFWETNGVLLKS